MLSNLKKLIPKIFSFFLNNFYNLPFSIYYVIVLLYELFQLNSMVFQRIKDLLLKNNASSSSICGDDSSFNLPITFLPPEYSSCA